MTPRSAPSFEGAMYKRLFVPALIIFGACTEKTETANVVREQISEAVYASGVVKSKNQYQLYATVSGVIDGIKVREGDLVKKGDIILSIRSEPSVLNLQNARLAAARADLASNTDKITQASAAVELARTRVKTDSLLWVRQRNLRNQGVGTQVELEQRELAYRTSATNYLTSLTNLRVLERDLNFSSRQSKTTMELNRSLVNEFSIRAAADGRVYKLFRENGELATVQSPVAVLGSADEFVLEMNVDEYDIARVRIGQPVSFTMDSYRGEVFEGKVIEIEPLMNEQSRSFLVKASLVTGPPTLYPNLTLEANIIIRSRQDALTIPRSFLVGDTAVKINKNEFRRVKVGIMDYRKAEILEGLSENEIIYKPRP